VQPPPEFDALPGGSRFVAAHAINVGQDDHQQTFLMLEVAPRR